MTYEEAVSEINSRLRFGSKLGLERMKALLNLLGNPQKKLKFIHVAGTNGKGTTCTYLACALQAAGYKTGLYTSPYVEDFRERFQIDGEMIPKEDLIESVRRISPLAEKVGEPITEFEYNTALGLDWFARQNCDIVVLEVGLGGRFDATNVIGVPEMAVITSISLDHTAILGNTVEKIAFEKGGIIKEGGAVVLYPLQETPAAAVIETLCRERNATLFPVPVKNIEVLLENLSGSRVRFGNLELQLPFSGRHQVYNAATAITALQNLKDFPCTVGQIQEGFAKAKMPARMELLRENPPVILDGGHNPGCAAALENLLERHLPQKKITAIMGMMADKDSHRYLSAVGSLFHTIIAVAPQNPRSLSAEALAAAGQEFCPHCRSAASVEEAVRLAFAEESDAIVVCGSLYLAGEIREPLCKKIKE